MRPILLVIFLSLLLTAACSRTQTATAEVQVSQVKEVTSDPAASVWNDVPLHISKMSPQDLVDPRIMEPSTAEVQVKAISDGSQIAFRLEWLDATQNDMPGPKHFIDGCAVQIPARIEANVPAPQMGEVGKTVEIAFWRADWQAIVEGRATDDIKSIYPNASIDHYPSTAKSLEGNPQALAEAASRYAPAKALGNRRAGPREQPVEDMIAEGPGTLTPAASTTSKGKGVKTKTGWAVVITRALPAGFSSASPSQTAFAVWEAAHGEVGARKMRTGWVPMMMK